MANMTFILMHVHELPNGSEDFKIVGVYSTKGHAEAALLRARSRPGFVESQGGFHIAEYSLDKDHWVEGFVTYPASTKKSAKKKLPKNASDKK